MRSVRTAICTSGEPLSFEHQVDRVGDHARIFDHVGDQLAHDAFELGVDFLVLANHLGCGNRIEAGVGVEGGAQHVHYRVSDVAQADLRHEGRGRGVELFGRLGDLFGFVADAFEIGDSFLHRDRKSVV